jgi:hypothetical protein
MERDFFFLSWQCTVVGPRFVSTVPARQVIYVNNNPVVGKKLRSAQVCLPFIREQCFTVKMFPLLFRGERNVRYKENVSQGPFSVLGACIKPSARRICGSLKYSQCSHLWRTVKINTSNIYSFFGKLLSYHEIGFICPNFAQAGQFYTSINVSYNSYSGIGIHVERCKTDVII